MHSPVVVVYLGDEHRGLDVVQLLDQRVDRPVHVVTASVDGLADILDDERIDCVICGPALAEGTLQTVVFDVADYRDDVPVFDFTGDVAAIPDRLTVNRIDSDAEPEAAVDTIIGGILDGVDATDPDESNPVVRGPVEYFAIDSESRVTDWDPRLSEWTDTEPAETVGENLWELLPSWDDTEFVETCREAIETEETKSATVFHEPSRKWFELSAVPLEPGGLQCYLHDITEYRNAGGKIEGTSARFEETLDRITDAFFALDTEERFVFLNSQAEFLLDVNANEVTGVRFWDAFPAAVSTTFYEEFQAAMENQEPTSFEEYYRPLDSWFEVNAYPSSGGLSVFLRDVTEQVRLQNKLEQLHDVTKELIVAESDREIASQTIDATESVLGFPLVTVWRYDGTTETMNPLAWSDAIDDRDVEMEPLGRDSEFIWEVYDTGEPRILGFVPATTMTSHHPGKVSSELLVPVGEYGVMGAYADEREAFDETDVELFRILASTVESAFARTERERQLARRNERLDDFASIVSHDLRNPLNVASSHVELARIGDDTVDHLDKIDESLYRMENLIEDLLARARGDQELERESLSLARTAKDAWEGVDTADATLTLDGDASLNADPDRLKQLFENLIRNAVEHGRDDVTVRVGPQTDGFYVADDGPGIPEDEQDDIFEQGVTHSDEGTGYGLAIVTDIVEGHGWRISATESAEGGAQFEVENVRSLTNAQEAQ
jgi:PAS domain S-box-containing protein